MIRGGLFAAAAGYLLSQTEGAALGNALLGLAPLAAVPLLLTSLMILLLLALRWYEILRALGVGVRYRQVLAVCWSGQAAGELGPPLLVGELWRFFGLRGEAADSVLVLAQAVDRFSGLVTLGLLLLIEALWFGVGPIPGLVWPGLLGGLALGFWLLGRSLTAWPPVFKSLPALLRAPASLRHYLLSVLIHLGLILNLIWAQKALSLDIPLPILLQAGPLMLAATTFVPGFFSDWGKREMALVLILGASDVPEAEALALSLLYGGSHLLMALPGFLVGRLGPSTAFGFRWRRGPCAR